MRQRSITGESPCNGVAIAYVYRSAQNRGESPCNGVAQRLRYAAQLARSDAFPALTEFSLTTDTLTNLRTNGALEANARPVVVIVREKPKKKKKARDSSEDE